MALTIYKSTILPLIEYADFVHDHNIKYVNKKLQSLQNDGLSVAYNQHIVILWYYSGEVATSIKKLT